MGTFPKMGTFPFFSNALSISKSASRKKGNVPIFAPPYLNIANPKIPPAIFPGRPSNLTATFFLPRVNSGGTGYS